MVVIVGYQIAKPPLFRRNAVRSRRRLMSHGPSGIWKRIAKRCDHPEADRFLHDVEILGGLLTRKRVLIPEGIGVDGLIQCVSQGDGTGIVQSRSHRYRTRTFPRPASTGLEQRGNTPSLALATRPS